MENKIQTDLGKILFKYNESKNDFDMIRIKSIDKENNKVTLIDINDMNNKKYFEISLEDYKNIKRNYSALKSSGILSISNIVTAKSESGVEVKDVLLVFFKNQDDTGEPDFYKPTIVARQSLEDIVSENINNNINKVGFSASQEDLPPDYQLTDLLINEKILDSRLYHIYLADKFDDILDLIDNEESENIFKDLYDREINHMKKTRLKFDTTIDRKSINGFCKSLSIFMKENDFVGDINRALGIGFIDVSLKNHKVLTEDDKVFLSLMYGGIKLDKTYVINFHYDIDMSQIKMKYFIIKDILGDTYIVGYTESPDEITKDQIKMSEQKANQFRDRLSKIAKAYDNMN